MYTSNSLKDKRNILRKIKNKMQNAFSLCAAEVEDIDNINYGTIGFGYCSRDNVFLQSLLNNLEEYLYSVYEIKIVSVDKEIYKFSDLKLLEK